MCNPIRVLHVVSAMGYGGTETLIMNLYRNIDRSKIQFDFIVNNKNKFNYDEEIVEKGGKIYYSPKYNGKNHFIYKKFWINFFKTHKEYTVIHGHLRSTATIYLSIAKKFGLVTIAHSHSTASRGNLMERIVKGILQYPIRYVSDYKFACSTQAGKWLFGNNSEYIFFRNGIEVEKYKFDQYLRDKFKKDFRVNDKIVFGHVGSFTYPKNHDFLINLFYEIQKNMDSVLLLIGDGPLKTLMEKKVQELGIKDKIIFLGLRNDVEKILNAMDVFLFPSIYEGLGIAVIEAQAAGLPCVISDKVPDDVILTNLVVKKDINNMQSWIDEIQKITSLKGMNRNRYSLEIEENGFDIKNTSKWYSDFIFECIKKKNLS